MSHENVIEVSFTQRNSIADEIESLLDLDDPLEELLNEFEDAEDLPTAEPFIKVDKAQDYRLQMQDTALHMTDMLLAQMKQVKEDVQRLSYYLDEMNIDN
ncbi:MAG: hypothetical protein VYA54_03170 [Bdellovibrionota bacterium]|nr:hypothetical protein [Bdellovibrionota bacterium]